MSEYRVIESRLIYKGKAFSFYSDSIEYNNKMMVKDFVLYPEAVAVLPILDNDKFVMIRQFRYPVKEELWEIPAGKLEPGEDIIEGAIRELEEETGYRAKKAKKVYEYYPAVGYSSEKIHIVVAKDLEKTQKNLDEDEFTEVEILTFNEIISMIEKNKIKDAKTIITFLLVKQLGGIYEI